MITVICYGEEMQFNTRDEAAMFFARACAGSEGSEHQRYETILFKLAFTDDDTVTDDID